MLLIIFKRKHFAEHKQIKLVKLLIMFIHIVLYYWQSRIWGRLVCHSAPKPKHKHRLHFSLSFFLSCLNFYSRFAFISKWMRKIQTEEETLRSRTKLRQGKGIGICERISSCTMTYRVFLQRILNEWVLLLPLMQLISCNNLHFPLSLMQWKRCPHNCKSSIPFIANRWVVFF